MKMYAIGQCAKEYSIETVFGINIYECRDHCFYDAPSCEYMAFSFVSTGSCTLFSACDSWYRVSENWSIYEITGIFHWHIKKNYFVCLITKKC